MRRSYKYRAYINKTTEANALSWLRICQQLYNKALEQRIKNYEEIKKDKENPDNDTKIKRISKYDQYALIKKKDHPEYKDIDAQCLEQVVLRLDEAYKHFFRRVKEKKGKAGFPKFQSWDRYNSFTLRQSGWKLEDNTLYIRNVGRCRLKMHRPFEGDIKTVTIKKEVNKWYIIFSCENVSEKPLPSTGKAIGIDVGIKSFLADSNENIIDNPKWFIQAERELRVKQRRLSRRKKGSNRRKKAREQVAKLHQRIANRRKDFVYNLTADYIRKYDTIAVENLNIKNMVQSNYRPLNKRIHDASWNLFFNHLGHKAEETGKQLIKVKAKDTTQLCSRCGNKPKVKVELKDRIYKCKKCGSVMDRDVNAAKNILGRAVPSGVKFSGYTNLSEKHSQIGCKQP